jgi:hypothetical protein
MTLAIEGAGGKHATDRRRQRVIRHRAERPTPRLHFYLYGEEHYIPRRALCHECDFERHLLESKTIELFGGSALLI